MAAWRSGFRTIRPVAYPGRAPHIHFAVSGPGMERLTTQMYVAGEVLNARDGILNRVRDPMARARLIVVLEPAAEVEPGALAGRFDIVLDERFVPG
jgi:protocatechuate 3,4-dioxygenase beta subunit